MAILAKKAPPGHPHFQRIIRDRSPRERAADDLDLFFFRLNGACTAFKPPVASRVDRMD
jgi:hypothetical protein